MNYRCKQIKFDELPLEIKKGDIYMKYDREVMETYQIEDIRKVGKKIKINVSHNYGNRVEFELNEQGKNEIFIRWKKEALEFIATGQKFKDWKIRMLAEASRGRRQELRKMVDDTLQV